MRDADVRHALLRSLRDRHDETDTLLVEELDLLGQVRVDVAVVNGAIHGYEIKSAKDTLRRLPRQVELYSRVLDHASLVAAEKHLTDAIGLLPYWWEVLVVGDEVGGPAVNRVRPGLPNPDVEAMALVQLLWRDEALAALAERGLDRGVRSKPRRHVWDRLVQCLELTDLQAEVRRCLKARTGWREHASPA